MISNELDMWFAIVWETDEADTASTMPCECSFGKLVLYSAAGQAYAYLCTLCKVELMLLFLETESPSG